jgi:hypothetical protein
MAKGILASFLILFLSSVTHADELFCNNEDAPSTLAHCGTPFLNIVSDGDHWKFMYISPDMSRAFSGPFLTGEDFIAVHFEISKADCTVTLNAPGFNVPSFDCHPRNFTAVTFQGATADVTKSLKAGISSKRVVGHAGDTKTVLRKMAFTVTLADATVTSKATATFGQALCSTSAQ